MPPPGPPSAPPGGESATALVTGTPQRTTFALIVGIERYRDLPPPPGAAADARAFAEIAKKTLGLPEANIRLAIDDRATRTDLEQQLEWLESVVPPGGRALFFFSGHGAPDATKGTPYLVPYEADARAIEKTGLRLDTVLETLRRSKARESIAFVDACFSGAGGRSVLPPGARPLVRIQEPTPTGAVLLLSSSSGVEISGPSTEGNQGLFTKYLVGGLGKGEADADDDGQLTLSELESYLRPRVTREASQQQRQQTPVLVVGHGAPDPKAIAVAWGLP